MGHVRFDERRNGRHARELKLPDFGESAENRIATVCGDWGSEGRYASYPPFTGKPTISLQCVIQRACDLNAGPRSRPRSRWMWALATAITEVPWS